MLLTRRRKIEDCMKSAVPEKEPSPVRKIYLSGSPYEKTFQYDDTAPSLPLPQLNDTIRKYLKSVEPFVSAEQYDKTKQIADKFSKGTGKILQEKLKIRKKCQRNWLAEWWLRYAYLTFREPLAPCLNMAGLNSLNLTIWNPSEEKALERAALSLWTVLDFYSNLREENIKPQVSRKGGRLNMTQLRSFFNATRIPSEKEDQIRTYFKTKSEGSCPQHIIIFCFGHIWYLNPWYSEGEAFSAPEIEHQLKYIQKTSINLGQGPGVGALTFDHREVWAKNRRWLSSLAAKNGEYLRLIDSAVMIYSIDESSPSNLDEACYLGLCGNPCNRWADKSYGGISFKNGYHCVSCDHTPYDAMMNVMLGHYQHGLVTDEFEGEWKGPKELRGAAMPFRLHFTLDTLIESSIERVKGLNASLNRNIGVIIREFNYFGKKWMQEQNIHPDAFVQCSLQLGYYLTHKKFAPTYETATTRQFYNGRTETVRSCTPELVNFVKLMADHSTTVAGKRDALLKAVKEHADLMTACKNGEGIDRHLMGLSIIASENGIPCHEFFEDPSFKMSGGGGNFLLSTSTTGYTPVLGGVAAMVKDGYGIFYSIHNDGVRFFMTNYVDGDSDLDAFFHSLSEALLSMMELFTLRQSKL